MMIPDSKQGAPPGEYRYEQVPTVAPEDRTLGDLLKELGGETRTLVRQEIALAKLEVQEKASKGGRHVGGLVVGGLVAYAGVLALVIAVAFLLGQFMPDWLGFVIVGLVALLTGYAVMQRAREGFKNLDLQFEHTTDTLRENKQWLKEEIEEVKQDPAHLGSKQ
jgi:hypothetical protein